MSGVDILLILIIIFGAYKGYQEGFLMTLVSLLAIILGVLGGFKLMGYTMVLLADKFNVDNTVLPYISFGIVFLLIVLLVSLAGRSLKASMDKNFLGRIDQAAGAALGLLKVVFMASVLIWIISSLKISPKESWIENSWLYPKIAVFAPRLTSWIGKLLPVFKDIF